MTITTAKYLAELFHEGQTRADKVTPYLEHPKMVAEFVEKFGGDDECIALAWLHDILEESADKVQAYFGFDRELDSVATPRQFFMLYFKITKGTINKLLLLLWKSQDLKSFFSS